MNDSMWSLAALCGRVVLSAIFLMSGVMKLVEWPKTAGHMAEQGIPAVPLLLSLAILCELGAGLCVLAGLQARLGAALLILFLIPTTLVFHDFWTFEGAQRENQMQHFMKNFTIMGGLLMLVASGAGRYSLDWWLRRRSLHWEERTHHEREPALAR